MSADATRRRLLQLGVAGATLALAGRAAAGSVGAGDGARATRTPTRPDAPHWLSTARFGEDDFRAVALDADAQARATRRLPSRAHGVAVHAGRGIGCVFARRPGEWLCTFDIADLAAARFTPAAPARRFTGHGAYSRDGQLLYTSENDIDRLRGVLGVHDVANGYRRIAELDSHGVGPHEIVRPAGSDLLIVANGGIATHPDHGDGRTPLNLASMSPSIVVLDARDGTRLSRHALPPARHRVSLRHLAVDGARRVWFAGQFASDPDDNPDDAPTDGAPIEDEPTDAATSDAGESDADAVAALPLAGSLALAGRHGRLPSDDRTHTLDALELPPGLVPQRHAYLSSVAATGRHVLYTASRDGVAFRIDAERRRLDEVIALGDCSGVAPDRTGFVVSNGTGEIVRVTTDGAEPLAHAGCAWDNHLHGTSA